MALHNDKRVNSTGRHYPKCVRIPQQSFKMYETGIDKIEWRKKEFPNHRWGL